MLTRKLRAAQEECNKLLKIVTPLKNDHSAYVSDPFPGC